MGSTTVKLYHRYENENKERFYLTIFQIYVTIISEQRLMGGNPLREIISIQKEVTDLVLARSMPRRVWFILVSVIKWFFVLDHGYIMFHRSCCSCLRIFLLSDGSPYDTISDSIKLKPMLTKYKSKSEESFCPSHFGNHVRKSGAFENKCLCYTYIFFSQLLFQEASD